MKEIKVKTRIVFEVEHILLTKFYDTDNEDEIIKQERSYTVEDPMFVMRVHKNKGTITTSVEKV